MAVVILAISTALQYVAAGMALRLIWVTKHRVAWVLISSAVFLMAVRRSITLGRYAVSESARAPDLAAESVALVISLLMCLGVAQIAPLFRELTRAADQVLRSQKRLQSILDHMPAAVYVKDVTGRYTLSNAYVERLVAPEGGSVVGHTDEELLTARLAQPLRENDAQVLAQRRPIEFDEAVVGRDGKRRDFLSIKFPLMAETGGEPHAVCGISTDITDRLREDAERRAFEAKLQHAQKLESLGVLAGGIAHDFNNLLVVIMSGIDLARSHPDLPPGAAEDLASALSASLAAGGLCRQLLAYTGKEQRRLTAVKLSDLVREMTKLMEVSVSKMARVTCNLDDQLPPIEADPSQLQQVVINLITNASDALGDEPGSIDVCTRMVSLGTDGLAHQAVGEPLSPGQYVALEVRDSGHGMDEETRNRLFEPFYTTKFTGRGLGLAALAGIVRSHAGGVAVESAPGQGTTFRVLFPAMRGLIVTQEATEEGAEVPPSGACILVVDDEPAVRQVAKRALTRAGFTVMTANNGRDALDQFRGAPSRFDLVLLDLTMPELDGIQTLAELKRIRPDVRVLLMSGYNAIDAKDEQLRRDLVGFLAKPYTAHALIEAINAGLEA